MAEDAPDANDGDVYSDPPSSDTVFEVLADRRRRHAIATLVGHDTAITLADLADEVAVREHEAALSEISAETVKQTYMSLYHTHVPKLEDANLIEYDQSGDLVTPTENVQYLEPFFDLLDRDTE